MSTMPRFSPTIIIKNPRNLEQLRYAIKPSGYQFERDGDFNSFYYRLELHRNSRHTTGLIRRQQDGVVLSASTSEVELAKKLYSTADYNAAANVGRILARRCHQAGILNVLNSVKLDANKKNDTQSVFLEAFTQAGISLTEPSHIEPSYEHDRRYHFVEERLLPM